MTPERIADLKDKCAEAVALSAAASPGPWEVHYDRGVDEGDPNAPSCPAWLVSFDPALVNHMDYRVVCRTVRTTAPDESHDAALIAASRQLVPDLAAGCLSLLAENDALRSAALGTPLAVLDALFTFAERECGHQPHSATHALTTVEEWAKRAKEEIAELRKALQPFAKAHITGHFLEIPRAAYTRAAAVLADPTAKKETT